MNDHAPRCYAAHPKTTYGSELARGQLAALRTQLPGWEIVDPEEARWISDAAWLKEWPRILATLDAIAIFGESGTAMVGAGCWQEWQDGVLAGLPTLGLDDDGALCTLVTLVPLPVGIRSFSRLARMWLSHRLSAADVAELSSGASAIPAQSLVSATIKHGTTSAETSPSRVKHATRIR